MGVIPQIHVNKPTTITNTTNPGRAGKVAIIGAFSSSAGTSTLRAFSDLASAETVLGTDTTLAGTSALKQLFNKNSGVSSVLVANITTVESETVQSTLTATKLANALNLLKSEDFDILFIAANMDDTALGTVKDFLDEAYDSKKPVGLIAPLTRTGTGETAAAIASSQITAYTTTANIFNDGGLYGFITQQFTIGSTELSLIDSAAYYAGLVASKELTESFTMKDLKDVKAITPEYTYSTNDLGEKLVKAGITVARCQSRIDNNYVIINSELPSGLDLYIERAKDYIIRDLAFESVLGERNRSITLATIKNIIETRKQTYINTLDLLEDLTYSVEKVSTNCINIYLNKLVFSGIVTDINVYVTVGVE